MQETITSTVNNYRLTTKVIGFSGIDSKGRSSIRDSGEVILITTQSYRVILYYNPAVESFHLSQDCIGINFNNLLCRFTLADGVSLIKGIVDNDSGLLAKRLVVRTCGEIRQNVDILDIIEETNEDFQKSGHLGASTLVSGEISKDGRLEILSIGSRDDIGMIRLIHGQKVDNIDGQARGFIGEKFHHYLNKQNPPCPYSLVVTSDGIKISDNDIKKILDVANKDFSPKPLKKIISDSVEENPDDQSLIVISKLDSK